MKTFLKGKDIVQTINCSFRDSSAPNSEVRLYKVSTEKGNADQQRSILPISVNAQRHNKDTGKLLGSH